MDFVELFNLSTVRDRGLSKPLDDDRPSSKSSISRLEFTFLICFAAELVTQISFRGV